MNTNTPPSPDSVLSSLSPVFRILAPALIVGCDASLRIFEEFFKLKRPDEPWLFAHQTRYVALRKLRQDGIADLGFEVAEIAQSGVFIHNADYEMRVLKATYRKDRLSGQVIRSVPNPGSDARKEYFHQPSLPITGTLGEDTKQRLKLVVLWDHDEDYQVTYMDLAAPRGWAQSRSCVDLHWLEAIPELEQDHLSVSSGQTTPAIQLDDVAVREKDSVKQKAADASGSR